MDDAKLNAYLNEMVNHVMDRNNDAISEAYWTTGAAMIDVEDGELVVKPIAYGELYKPLSPEQKAQQAAALEELAILDRDLLD